MVSIQRLQAFQGMGRGFRTLFLLFLLVGCQKASDPFSPDLPADNAILDGPVPGLNSAETLEFIAGDVAFNDEVFSASTGLGPCFVASSCGACHPADGKGHPFTSLTRFGQSDSTGNRYLQSGGPQLQHRAIPGHIPEKLPSGAPFSLFMPPANTGLGYVEALTDAQILANADPEDANGDGISGRPNYIAPPNYFIPTANHQPFRGFFIGRFGKKAASISLLHQTAKAYNQDMGVTSLFEPIDPCTGLEGDPEVSNRTIQAVVFYLKTLKAPIQRNPDNPDVLAGKKLFMETGCGACHTPSFTTGKNPVEALSNKVFNPYSDFLLHDMGPGLDDGYTEGMALSSEWRTPPLWGVGLAKNAQGGRLFLMHDGRASSFTEAILLHGGEAEKAKNEFQSLPPKQQNQLIQFLESL